MTGKFWQIPLLALIGMSAAALPAQAQTEHREFNVQVDGKPAGQSTLSIAKQIDGSFIVTGQVTVKVKQIVGSYSYTYSGSETWKDGKLVQLRSTSNDNGKRFDVTAHGDAKALRVVANSREHSLRPESWTTSYWKLADAKFHNNIVPILDVDTGKEISGRLSYVGAEQMQVAGQAGNCYHFRVTGGQGPVDLWFDAQHLLVRQEFTEDGHRTVVQLTGIRK